MQVGVFRRALEGVLEPAVGCLLEAGRVLRVSDPFCTDGERDRVVFQRGIRVEGLVEPALLRVEIAERGAGRRVFRRAAQQPGQEGLGLVSALAEIERRQIARHDTGGVKWQRLFERPLRVVGPVVGPVIVGKRLASLDQRRSNLDGALERRLGSLFVALARFEHPE